MKAKIETARLGRDGETWHDVGELILTDEGLVAKPAGSGEARQTNADHLHDIMTHRREHLESRHEIKSDEQFLRKLHHVMGRLGRCTIVEDSSGS